MKIIGGIFLRQNYCEPLLLAFFLFSILLIVESVKKPVSFIKNNFKIFFNIIFFKNFFVLEYYCYLFLILIMNCQNGNIFHKIF